MQGTGGRSRLGLLTTWQEGQGGCSGDSRDNSGGQCTQSGAGVRPGYALERQGKPSGPSGPVSRGEKWSDMPNLDSPWLPTT